MNSSANVSTFYSTLSSVICICRYQLRRIRFTLSVVLPLFLLAIPSNAVAQLSDGAVVAIRTSSRYMTANDNSVYESSITNLWANSLWVVSMNGDNEYSFRNVGNSKYLSCNKSGSD